MAEAFPLVEVSGPPRERGRQYGRQAAARIHVGVEHYTGPLNRLALDAAAIRDLVAEFVPRMAAFDPAYVEEMRGIAEGAGLAFAYGGASLPTTAVPGR